MKQSTRREQRRQAHARQWAQIVALHEAGVSKCEIARQCRCCRQTVYNVLAKAQGLAPGQSPLPRPPGPQPGTGAGLPALLVAAVVQWRLEHAGGYHLCRASLQRAGLRPPAAATIRKLWLRAGLLVAAGQRIRPVTRWVPPRPQSPGHVQVDVKYLPGRRYEFTALDVYSRFAAGRVTESLDSTTARSFLLELLAQLPFTLHTVQVDGGSEFRAEFAAELEQRGLGLRRNSPHSPWQNGVVERFHRTVASECYALLDRDPQDMSTAALERELQTYLKHYNYRRLHSSLSYRPPAELLGTRGEPVYPQIPKRCPTIP